MDLEIILKLLVLAFVVFVMGMAVFGMFQDSCWYPNEEWEDQFYKEKEEFHAQQIKDRRVTSVKTHHGVSDGEEHY